MSNTTRSMTKGAPLKLLVSFALPLMLGNVFQQCYIMVDTMIVGQALGVQALAALGAADWLNWLVLGTIQGLTQGFSIRMAHAFGAKDGPGLRAAMGHAVTLSLWLAGIILVLAQLMVHPVLLLLRTPSDILPGSQLYLRVMFAGVPAMMAYNLLAGMLRSIGDSRTPLLGMIIASVVNVVLDLLFVMVLPWGIGGAAAATVLSQVVASLICFLRLHRMPALRIHKNDLKPTREQAKSMLLLGTPVALQNVTIAIGGVALQYIVNDCGILFIAGFTAANKLYGLLEIAASSYGFALTTYVGQNLGAGEIKRIKKGVRTAGWLSLLTSLVIMALMLVFGRWFLSWFISGTPEEMEITMGYAFDYLALMSLCLPVLYILYVGRAALQGSGNTVLPMVSGIAELVMRVGGAAAFPLFLGNEGIFCAEVAAWFGANFVLIPGWLSTMRHLDTRSLPHPEPDLPLPDPADAAFLDDPKEKQKE